MIASGHNSVGVLLAAGAIELSSVSPSNSTAEMAAITIAIVLMSVVSHYLFDMIPHGHYHLKQKSSNISIPLSMFLIGACDLILSAVALLAVCWYTFDSGLFFIFVASVLASQLPDLIMIINNKKWSNNKLIKAEQRFHAGIVHWHDLSNDQPRPWRITDIWQVGLFIATITILATLY